ncbi:protein kinase [Blastomyces dermatitidis ATCC 18188]|uniref:non-specific serine/threonine protein kinase n=1 Tax=Ajellomyces dermatitidis (strain ATCC 18188 / CBS 674.68) TaxID=653446 RepID=F2TE11_AJEDA|nr:protein kinase [Blastomyces dermatitidis ATCC 18188]
MLKLTFSKGPKNYQGFVLGRESHTCDIVLASQTSPDVSGSHCFLTFNEYDQLILHDTSTNGTIVSYNGKGAENRKKFSWIVAGHPVPDEEMHDIVIQLGKDLSFRIVCAKRTNEEEYTAKIRQFRSDLEKLEESALDSLNLESRLITAHYTQSHSPRQEPLLLALSELGRGAFGVVTCLWDVSCGVTYAQKTPLAAQTKHMAQSEHDQLIEEWGNEIDLLKSVSHDHIVRLLHWVKEPVPQLYLEYMKFGNLNQIGDITDDEVLMRYFPPEIAERSRYWKYRELYTHAVDIWSLGVVILELTHGLPSGGARDPDWGNKIIDKSRIQRNGIQQVDVLMKQNSYLLPPELVTKPRATSYAAGSKTTAIFRGVGKQLTTPHSPASPIRKKHSRVLRSSLTSPTSTITPHKRHPATLHARPYEEQLRVQDPACVVSPPAQLGRQDPSDWDIPPHPSLPQRILQNEYGSQNNPEAYQQANEPYYPTRPLQPFLNNATTSPSPPYVPASIHHYGFGPQDDFEWYQQTTGQQQSAGYSQTISRILANLKQRHD